MALSQTLSLTNNFDEFSVFPDAYIQVAQVSATKQTCTVSYLILRKQKGQKLEERFSSFPHDLEGPNPIKQAYLHLKTLPEFADAIDC